MKPYELIATCPMGIEAVVARELKLLGYDDARTENGRVRFSGDLIDICRCNYWLRTADRIVIKMAEFKATTFDELFEGVKAVSWADFIPADGEFPVSGRSQKSQLSSVPASQGIVKKAIVEKLKQTYNTEWFPEDGALYAVDVSLMDDVALITMDTTGPSLHKRGYRKNATEAPLKETLAAALILLSRWGPHRPLYDPFCGSGTLLIEAAMIGWNIAPGLRRTFPSEGWSIISDELWEAARDEAFDAVQDDIPLDLVGSDIDPSAIEIARACAKSAGLGEEIEFKVMPVSRIQPKGKFGCIITNPPYGERLSETKEVEAMIRDLGKASIYLPDWSVFAITPTRHFEQFFGRKADKRRKLYNGRIECQFLQYLGPLPPRAKAETTESQA
ncbi:class I SAM-dependent RNA methyltransferase [Paenibacillus hunanensis]|uniref:THUMP domain-containing class I SAM-dependent RNA methyltransferase n=1 Tax=Paenibacillus hunanensis TaxID=539262 RepID=UPI0020272991|nr:class I SAM-dependent RNA methyltransferase [Paenibacillus hunanensis]MCL9663177.1 class I SAM-dependent RNA methyltransferase [Paenibacillus hunanensis]WPP40055.1 class I SAM-dependent RNA methyltransferase [Paenibacillus hunanensis]